MNFKIKNLFKKKQLVFTTTPYGFKFKGPDFLNYKNFELSEQKFVNSQLHAFGAVINIGANIGFYTCLALHFGKSVLAFEPLPSNFQSLLENISANGWQTHCRAYQCALGVGTNIVEMFGEGTGASLVQGWAGGSKIVTRVPQFSLNDFSELITEPSLFVVDVEGSEQSLLMGATKILQQELNHTWLIEISINEHQPVGITINPHLESTFALFNSFGYNAHFMCGDLISQTLVAQWQRNENLPSTHNFVFRKN